MQINRQQPQMTHVHYLPVPIPLLHLLPGPHRGHPPDKHVSSKRLVDGQVLEQLTHVLVRGCVQHLAHGFGQQGIVVFRQSGSPGLL